MDQHFSFSFSMLNDAQRREIPKFGNSDGIVVAVRPSSDRTVRRLLEVATKKRSGSRFAFRRP
jgi:hypothetical protein